MGFITIPKSTSRDRIRENAGVFDFELTPEQMERLDGLDVVLFVETVSENLPRVARSMGIKTVCIPMVEWLPMDKEWTHHVDLWLAATQFSFNQLLTLGVKGNVACCPWPIDVQAFEFQQRTRCDRFVFAHGNGGPRDRKGGRVMAEAARLAPDIPLIVYSQVQHGFRSTLTEDVEWPDTVDFRGALDSPTALYQEGDVFVLQSRWEGLGLQLFESQAAGMPLITTDGPPMNEANPWKRLPCTPTKVRLSHDYVSFDVSPETIVDAMRASLGADITEASRSARQWVAENRDWSKRAPAILKSILEG
jgi:glycosyltransferase involved in cell wall biosynthesis